MNNRKLEAVGSYSGSEDNPKLPSALIYKDRAKVLLHLLELRTTHYVVYGAERSERAGQALGG